MRLAAVFASLLATAAASGTFLDLTAIVTHHNNSALECWRLADPFTTSAGAGTAGAATLNIAGLANATYTVLPPRFEGGVHNAPHPQCVPPLPLTPRARSPGPPGSSSSSPASRT